MGGNPLQSIYRKFTSFSDVVQQRRMKHRTQLGEADPRDTERLGHPGRSRPEGTVIWAHASGLERLAPVPELVRRLALDRGEAISLLATTPEDVPSASLSKGAIHQLAPLDSSPSVERFLDHWKPDLVVFSGDQLIRSAIYACNDAGIPLVWVDARFRKSTLAAISRSGSSLQLLFNRIFTVSEEETRAITGAGVDPDRVKTSGRLQEEAVALPCNEAERDYMAGLLAARPVWLSVSVAPEDIAAIDPAHRRASRRSHRILLILVPAPGCDAISMAKDLQERGWQIVLRSSGEEPAADTQVLIADELGEEGLWYRLAPSCYFAGTHQPDRETRNPYEAAALGSAIIHGPFVGGHQHRFDKLARAGASRLVQSPDDLGAALEALLSPDKAAMMAEAAWRVASEGADATDLVMADLSELLDLRDTFR